MEVIAFVGITIILILDCKRLKQILQSFSDGAGLILERIILFIKDWKNAVSFLIAWMITNGWGWVFMILGRYLHIKWMKYVGDAYIAFLWMPFVNEKIVTIALATLIKKIAFRKKELKIDK